jgi:hypothetical protein
MMYLVGNKQAYLALPKNETIGGPRWKMKLVTYWSESLSESDPLCHNLNTVDTPRLGVELHLSDTRLIMAK